MANVIEALSKYAKTEKQKTQLMSWFNEFYKPGYVKKLKAKLSADSRTMSSMITGPANFPVRSNQKKLDIAHKRLTELLEWDKRVRNKMRAKLVGNEAISSTDPEAVNKLKKKLETAEKNQQVMKDANKIARSKKLSDTEKIKQLEGIGIKDGAELLKPDFAGRVGFASYALSNNSANIKRIKSRITALENRAEKAEETGGKETRAFDGGSIELNYEDGFFADISRF